MRKFIAVKKLPDEFCAKSMTWKATNGVVCHDCYTQKEAERSANQMNVERGVK